MSGWVVERLLRSCELFSLPLARASLLFWVLAGSSLCSLPARTTCSFLRRGSWAVERFLRSCELLSLPLARASLLF
jgi:hypothetical protein